MTIDILPVELNSYLGETERLLSEFNGVLGNEVRALVYNEVRACCSYACLSSHFFENLHIPGISLYYVLEGLLARNAFVHPLNGNVVPKIVMQRDQS